jgi:AraC-like DNA-binding protein
MDIDRDSLRLLADSLYSGCGLGLSAILVAESAEIEALGRPGGLERQVLDELGIVAGCLLGLEGEGCGAELVLKIESRPGMRWLSLRAGSSWRREAVIVAGPFAPEPRPRGNPLDSLALAGEGRMRPIGQLLLAAVYGPAARFPLEPRELAPWKSGGGAEGAQGLSLSQARAFDKVSAGEMLRLRDCIRAGDLEALRSAIKEAKSLFPSRVAAWADLGFYKSRVVSASGICSHVAIDAGMEYLAALAVAEKYIAEIERAEALEPLWNIAGRMLEDFARGVAESARRGHSKKARAMIRYMREHFRAPVSLRALAEAASLSPNYASGLLKRETGMSLRENLNAIRVEEAKKLLTSTTRPIREVAEAVGFDLPNHFAKVFKARTGMSPSEFRSSVSRT